MKNQKNNKFIERSNYEKVTHYSIRKVSFGAASVAIAVAFMFLGGRSVSAAEYNNALTTNQRLMQILKIRMLIKFLMLQARTLM